MKEKLDEVLSIVDKHGYTTAQVEIKSFFHKVKLNLFRKPKEEKPQSVDEAVAFHENKPDPRLNDPSQEGGWL